MLDQEDLAGQHLALPRLIAYRLVLQHQLTLVTDVDRWYLGRFLDVVGHDQAWQQRQGKYEMFHPDDTPLLCYNDFMIVGMGQYSS
ncbi:hypothetical protein D3C76_1466970 [compost metagenome]